MLLKYIHDLEIFNVFYRKFVGSFSYLLFIALSITSLSKFGNYFESFTLRERKMGYTGVILSQKKIKKKLYDISDDLRYF